MVRVFWRDRYYTFEGKVTGLEVIKRLGLKEEEVLLLKDGKLLPPDIPLEEGEIKVIPVISGG